MEKSEKNKRVVELAVIEDLEESGVTAVSLVDEPAIEKYWVYLKQHNFVDPQSGETQDEFIGRCMSKLVGDEGYAQDQAYAICISTYENKSAKKKMGTDTSGLAPYVDEVPKKKKKFQEDCPPATLDIEINLANRQKAIDKAMYGPLDIKNPGDYWDKVAAKWKVPVEEAKGEICGNCAAFNITKKMKACIAEGIGEDAEDVIEAGELGYCEFFDFKCNANRSCLAHVDGGPIKDEEFADEKDDLEDVCEDGYEAYGLKELNGRMVPNCVPIKNSKFTRISEYNTKFATDEDQKIIVGAAMIPDMEIYRRDDDGKEYYVKFSKETIAKVAEKFMKELRVHSTNLEHDETVNANSFVFESWLVETLSDKANTKYNLDVPVGTWMLKLKVSDPAVWEAVKAGKYKGFSIEGNFVDKKELENIEKEKEMVEEIMRILNS